MAFGVWRARAATVLAGLALSIAERGAAAAEDWAVAPLADAAAYEALAAETGAQAPDGLPDGFVAEAPPGVTDVARAWYAAPTTRYAHGVIGDAVEAGALVAQTREGEVLRVDLPPSEVFEDRTPRIADLDGDGRAEIVTIRASATAGAAASVYGLADGGLGLRATTPFIGRSNRWLNIAALADLAGLGRRQIAYVETPHIGGTLHLYDFDGDGLVRLASMRDFSNHAIGARELRLSAVIAAASGGPALAAPDARRARLRVVAIAAGGWRELASIALPARLEGPIVVAPEASARNAVQDAARGADEASAPRLWTRLADGVVYEIFRRP